MRRERLIHIMIEKEEKDMKGCGEKQTKTETQRLTVGEKGRQIKRYKDTEIHKHKASGKKRGQR